MNLVSGALRRPVTVIVAVLALVLGGSLAIQRMARDVFPSLGIPTIYVAQPYGGMDPGQMEGFLTYYYEYHFLYITGIEHVESKSIQGVSLIKLQFHAGTDMAQAMAETVSYVNRARSFMPPGTVPPFIMRFDAGSVPVGDLIFSSPTRTVGEIQDLALNRVRPLFATLPGVSAPPPFGGNQRTIVIHVLPERLRAYQLSPEAVVHAVAEANAISPAGNVRIGDRMPMVPTNATVSNIQNLAGVTIRPGVFLRDLGTISDSTDVPSGYALVNGHRAVYIPVTKRADASTLAVVALVKKNLPRFQSVLPGDVRVRYAFDQSPYVTRAITGLLVEGLLGAILTGLMVTLFLRDLRSAVVVVANIPLALLGAVVALWATGQTVNLMTLGGLALAVGILVDQSTVAIENLHAHLGQGKPLARAVVDSGREVALPLLVSMLCILSVFVPAFFMTGIARALFLPLSLAVGFSMVASYVLSTTFVPVLSARLLRHHRASAAHPLFERLQAGYGRLLATSIRHGRMLVAIYLVGCAAIVGALGARLGTEVFPAVESGQFQLRMRAPAGTRIEKTQQICQAVLRTIQREARPGRVAVSVAFVGVQPPSYPINTIYLWTGGPGEAVIQVQLAGVPRVEPLKERLRRVLAREMPSVRFSFEPSDIADRVMSLGASTPVEVAVSGPRLEVSKRFAQRVVRALAAVPVLRDVQIAQSLDYPTVTVDVDRERAGVMGVTAAQVARSTLAATSSSRYLVPSFWRDAGTGIAYQVQVEVPPERMDSLQQVADIPVTDRLLLRDVARVASGTTEGEYDRYNMQRMVTVTANVAGQDLGRASARVEGALRRLGPPPPHVQVSLRGQVAPLRAMLSSLQGGLLLAVVAIFLLLAANFQSLRLSLAVVSTVPAAMAGVVAALALSGTTLNLESFMGGIMSLGVAVANAILLVTFAERFRLAGGDASAAAVEGARSRLRPILMTTGAMLVGMLPMALALGEGGEQTAPLGLAVVGGLGVATLATLFILPAVFTLLSAKASRESASLDPDDPTSPEYAP